MPLTMTDELPATSPAFAIGLPGTIASIITPWSDGTRFALASAASIVSPSSPSHGCATWPCAFSSGITVLAMSIGIAKPTPTFPLTSELLGSCALMPITAPERSISGPPELPWLIAASVCSALLIAKSFGAEIWRWIAEMTPAVSVRSSPNGLPMATTESPTSTLEESPSGSGCRALAGRSTLRTARSVEASEPMTRARTLSLFENETRTPFWPWITCSLVRM